MRLLITLLSLSFIATGISPALAHAAAPGNVTLPFNQGWLFGGKSMPMKPERITLPHVVTKLSWQNWDYRLWQDVWVYKKDFTLPENMRGMRVFIHFDGVMTGIQPAINGHKLEKHLGGFLPVRYELTKYLRAGDAINVLAIEVDGRWSNVPPQGSPIGPEQVDYLMPAGIHRQATLVTVPQTYIKDVFAKPVNVLDAAARRVEVIFAIDAGGEGTEAGEIPNMGIYLMQVSLGMVCVGMAEWAGVFGYFLKRQWFRAHRSFDYPVKQSAATARSAPVESKNKLLKICL